MHLVNIADRSRPDQLAGAARVLAGIGLGRDLSRHTGLARGVNDSPTFADRAGQRFDAADVLLLPQRRQRNDGMGVIRSAAIDGVDLVTLGRHHLSEVLVPARLRPAIVRLLRVNVVQITERDDLETLLFAGLHLSKTHAPDPDGSQGDFVAGRGRPTQHMARDDRSGGKSRGSFEQTATTEGLEGAGDIWPGSCFLLINES